MYAKPQNPESRCSISGRLDAFRRVDLPNVTCSWTKQENLKVWGLTAQGMQRRRSMVAILLGIRALHPFCFRDSKRHDSLGREVLNIHMTQDRGLVTRGVAKGSQRGMGLGFGAVVKCILDSSVSLMRSAG